MNSVISDSLGRTFKTLRISLNDVCNLACTYCVGEEEAGMKSNSLRRKNYLNNDQLVAAVEKILPLTEINTVRLTGGEPLLYKDITALVASLKKLGIPKVKMTTNGVLLPKYAEALVKAGLDSVNISLDSLQEETFFKMTRRRNLKEVLAGIEVAQSLNLSMKLNAVIMRGVNSEEIVPLLEFAASKNAVIRYLELMKMGPLHASHGNSFYSEKEILTSIKEKYSIIELKRTQGSTANYWITEDLKNFGIISNTSSPFCHDCDRLRLDSSGKVFGCLSNPNGISIVNSLDNKDQMTKVLQTALHQKKMVFTGSELSMKSIGG